MKFPEYIPGILSMEKNIEGNLNYAIRLLNLASTRNKRCFINLFVRKISI
ncbi:unnamed protein product [Ixodes persulcatus]